MTLDRRQGTVPEMNLTDTKMIPPGEPVDLDILDVVYRGRGLARHEGCVVFVPGVLPGEKIRARITRRHKNHAEAELVSVLTPSPARMIPACPLARPENGCPGCSYQHAAYEEEIRMKQAQLENLLQRMGHVQNPKLLPPVPSPSPLGYRNKIVLHARVIPGAVCRLGYYAEDNRTLLDVPACPLAMDPINRRLKELRETPDFLPSLADRASLTLRYTDHDGVLSWTDTDRTLPDWLTETTPLGTLLFPPTSFSQVNPVVAGLLLTEFQSLLAETVPASILDLYCGMGLFSFAAAGAGVRNVAGMDSDTRAIQAARKNAARLNLPHIHFITAAAEQGLKRLPADFDPKNTTLVVDPPRTGLGREVIRHISAFQPTRMIYISCAADTLARDIAWLGGEGYTLTRARLFDMFPRTALFETMACLERSRV